MSEEKPKPSDMLAMLLVSATPQCDARHIAASIRSGAWPVDAAFEYEGFNHIELLMQNEELIDSAGNRLGLLDLVHALIEKGVPLRAKALPDDNPNVRLSPSMAWRELDREASTDQLNANVFEHVIVQVGGQVQLRVHRTDQGTQVEARAKMVGRSSDLTVPWGGH